MPHVIVVKGHRLRRASLFMNGTHSEHPETGYGQHLRGVLILEKLNLVRIYKDFDKEMEVNMYE